MHRTPLAATAAAALALFLTACGSLSTTSDPAAKVHSALSSGSGGGTGASTAGDGSTKAAQEAPMATPITKSGTGDAVITLKSPLSSARIVTSTHSGSANFVLETLDSKGADLDLLVNAIGTYRGTVLLVPDASVSAFKITADGPWTLLVRDVRAATRWTGAKPVKGTGDTVLIIPGGTKGLTSVKLHNSGQGNFVVYATDDGDRTLLVNEIGSWTGTEALADATVMVDILSDGAWSMTPVG